MFRLPRVVFFLGGTLIYGVLYPTPDTLPAAANFLFLASVLAAFVYIPRYISSIAKRQLNRILTLPQENGADLIGPRI